MDDINQKSDSSITSSNSEHPPHNSDIVTGAASFQENSFMDRVELSVKVSHEASYPATS